jgi:surface polysaccharide O-acyltransferase-like enzyme
LEALRALAFLGVLLQHIIGPYIRMPGVSLPDAIMLGLIFNIIKFAVPTFVFITGIVLLHNYYERVHYPRFIKKRAAEIFFPYVIWSVIYFISYHGMPGSGTASFRELGKSIASGSASYHLWFVVMIFQFYLLYPMLLALFKGARSWISSSKGRFAGVLGICGILYGALMWFSHTYIPEHDFHLGSQIAQLLLVEFRDRTFLYYLFYFILGGIAGVAMLRWRRLVIQSVPWNVLLFTGFFIWIGYELMVQAPGGKIGIGISTSLKPSMFLYTVSEIVLLYGLSLCILKNNPILYRVLRFIGRYSFGAYLVHALTLTYIMKWLRPFDYFTSQVIPAVFFVFALNVMFSLGVTFLISRLPFGKWLIGSTGKRKPRAPKKEMAQAVQPFS